MDVLTAKSIIDEYSEQKGLMPAPPQRYIDFNADLFDKQIDFIDDPARRKAALCSRRAGKSRMASYYLMKEAYEKPKSKCVFVAITRASAQEIIWDYLLDINNRYKIGAKANISNLSLVLPNKSKIYLTGADNPKEIRKLLGNYFDLCVIDEADALGSTLEPLIKEVLSPTTLDYDGTICVISTPGIVCHGMFYDITKPESDARSKWSVHRWTVLENPKMPRPGWNENREAILDEFLEIDNIIKGSSQYIRQYLGEWVEASESLVYGFKYNKNTYYDLPEDKHFHHIIGVDFGVTDESAIIVGAYSLEDRTLYIIDEFKQAQLAPEQMAHVVKDFSDKYSPVAIVVDGNGIGKAFVAQIQLMYELPVELAEKKDKIGFSSIMNDEIKGGKIKFNKLACPKTIKEITKYLWADPILKLLPEVADDHLMDALLYLFRKSLHFKGVEPVKVPSRTDADYGKYLLDQELKRIKDEANLSWWEI